MINKVEKVDKMLNKDLLKDYYQNDLLIVEISGQRFLSERVFNSFKRDTDNIIRNYQSLFPKECALISQALFLAESHVIYIQSCISLIEKYIDDMYETFDHVYKAPKLFISHSTEDRDVVEKFVTMLEQIGVKQKHLFCSSIPAYGISQGTGNIYDYIRSEMDNDNLFVIMMLSHNYYLSPVCLNEMGAAWIKQASYQSILLPGFSFPEIKGAIDPRDMSFSLEDVQNRNQALNDLKDRLIAHLELEPIEYGLWERFRNKFISEL